MDNKLEMVRINTRVSVTANRWLDSRSLQSGVPKSTLISLALEEYIHGKEALSMFDVMANIKELEDKIESLEKLLQRKGLE